MSARDPGPEAPPVALLTSHGRVLLFFATHPAASMHEAGLALYLSERTVGRVITDLRAAGWIEPVAEGNGHRYVVHAGSAAS